MGNDWAENIPSDLIYVLAQRVRVNLSDLIRFSSVCRSWNTLLVQHQWLGFSQQLEALVGMPSIHLPNLIFADDDDNHHNFFHLQTKQNLSVQTGLFQDILDAKGLRCCGSTNGWLITIGDDMEIHLMNPITKEQLQLPSQLTFGDLGNGLTNEMYHTSAQTRRAVRDNFIEKAILVGDPRHGCTIAAIVLRSIGSRLAFVREGRDQAWTVVTTSPGQLIDIAYHHGLLYGLAYKHDYSMENYGIIRVWNLNNTGMNPIQEMRRVMLWTPPKIDMNSGLVGSMYHLVEVSGELFGVTRPHPISYFPPELGMGKNQISDVKVFKLKDYGRWEQVNNLADCCWFISNTTSMVLSSSVASGFRKNCIYFTIDWFLKGSLEVSVFNLENGVHELLCNVSTKYPSKTSNPPIWVSFMPNNTRRDGIN